MTIKRKTLLLCTVIFLLIFAAQTNAQIFENNTIKKNIKTVLIYKEGWQLSFPVININNEDEKIILSFDELGNSTGNYSWKITYCNKDWTVSNLDAIDYIEGFQKGYISDYQLSKNTKVNYINYKVTFPNDDMQFIKTGNYGIIIYENDDPEQIVLTRRFYVNNSSTRISGSIFKQPVANITNNQTVNFTIEYNQDLIDPASNISATIIKNNEDQISTDNISPSKFTTNQIAFEHIKTISFPGINEYRHFDTKSLKFLSDKIEHIENADKYYKVLLRPDEILSGEKYTYKPDLNGKRFIKLENNEQSDIEADYCMVTFRLNAPINLNAGNYYVYGALSDWKIKDEFKMEYNEKGYYTVSVLLKQGYYNYRYIFNTEIQNIAEDASKFYAEGNFYQTENDYYILCYYRNPNDLCDELIGFAYINTEKN